MAIKPTPVRFGQIHWLVVIGMSIPAATLLPVRV